MYWNILEFVTHWNFWHIETTAVQHVGISDILELLTYKNSNLLKFGGIRICNILIFQTYQNDQNSIISAFLMYLNFCYIRISNILQVSELQGTRIFMYQNFNRNLNFGHIWIPMYCNSWCIRILTYQNFLYIRITQISTHWNYQHIGFFNISEYLINHNV